MLIIIEGIDGSGKATQSKLLVDYFKQKKRSVEKIDFPRYYDNFFGGLIAECLRGDHGDFVKLDPKIASVLYASDRFETSQEIKKWLKEDVVVISDRYTTSNLIHQGGKISKEEDRLEFISWLEKMEYGVFNIPVPDLVIYLDVPIEISLSNLKEKKEKYTNGKADSHEKDFNFLNNSRKTALWFTEKSDNWQMVDCVFDGKMKSKEDINLEIIKKIEDYENKN